MKIAIKANPSRGEEIISLLESLGGIKGKLTGSGTFCIFCYYIDKNNLIRYDIPPEDYKVYTLEEFEKEFPFKVGDIVLLKGVNKPYEVIALELYMNELCYKLNSGLHYRPETLITYKEMTEERNITLTLDKAKEWYKKGGELREIALQAFNEKELNPLPKSWEEFCAIYSKVDDKEYFIDSDSNIEQVNSAVLNHYRLLNADKNICSSKKSAEAHLALIQLEQLRDCWRQGNIPQEFKYKIKKVRNKHTVLYGEEDAFLSFCDKQTAEEFLKCFRDLIEKAGDLI